MDKKKKRKDIKRKFEKVEKKINFETLFSPDSIHSIDDITCGIVTLIRIVDYRQNSKVSEISSSMLSVD